MMNLLYLYLLILLSISAQLSISCASQISDQYHDHHKPELNVEPVAAAAAGYLFADNTDSRLNLSDPIDAQLSIILDRDGPDLRPSRGFKDFPDISLEIAQRAWQLLHQHALIAAHERVNLVQPVLEDVLTKAQVSNECLKAIGQVLESAKRLDSWAIRLINSWGSFPPVGIFEGTNSDVGAFHTCINIAENKLINHTHYCSVTFRPILPVRKDYELVMRKEPKEMLNLFSRTESNYSSTLLPDAFEHIMNHAQYHHYIYFKWGTCWPIGCSPFDVRRVAKLIGRRNVLSNGPVKCYSKFEEDYEQPGSVEVMRNSTVSIEQPPKQIKLEMSIWDKNNGIFIWKPNFNRAQQMALAVIMTVLSVVTLCTLIDIIVNRIPSIYLGAQDLMKGYKLASEPLVIKGNGCELESLPINNEEPHDDLEKLEEKQNVAKNAIPKNTKPSNLLMELVSDFSMIDNTVRFFSISESQMKNITCLFGIRCITMIWIIMTHTMMYNDWTAFARTRQIEHALNSPFTQPLFNGSYLVDSFFLMSGLVGTYTAFKHCKGQFAKFNSFAYLLNRWLRLSFQIFFVSMIYIVLPALAYGPHWIPIVLEFSEHCQSNWWVNVLHAQAFYKQSNMCNMVTWWISIDSLYHFIGLFAIWAILLLGHKYGCLSVLVFVVANLTWMFKQHFANRLPPNLMSTIPSTGAMWTDMTLGFFWQVYSHTVPYFLGLYLGYLMAIKQELIIQMLNTRRALICWTLSVVLFIGQSYSTFWWVTGQTDYPRWLSTVFNVTCPIIWAFCISWFIVACHHGYGGFVDRFLSSKPFIIIGRASYMVYLSHFQIIFIFLGSQNILLEPTNMIITFMIIGNTVLATVYGIFLCIAMELPWLNIQRRLTSRIFGGVTS